MLAKSTRSKYSQVYSEEQYLFNLDVRILEAERMNESYAGVEAKNIYEDLYLCFYSNWLGVGSRGSILGNTFRFCTAVFYSLRDVLIKKNQPKIWNLDIFNKNTL